MKKWQKEPTTARKKEPKSKRLQEPITPKKGNQNRLQNN